MGLFQRLEVIFITHITKAWSTAHLLLQNFMTEVNKVPTLCLILIKLYRKTFVLRIYEMGVV